MNFDVKRQARFIQKASSKSAISVFRANSNSDCWPDFHRVFER
jgi:hypothetical protein